MKLSLSVGLPARNPTDEGEMLDEVTTFVKVWWVAFAAGAAPALLLLVVVLGEITP